VPSCPEKGVDVTHEEIWTYRTETGMPHDVDAVDIVGYGVEALDGSIGKVDEATYDAGSAHLVIDTGPWIFGQKVVLPAGIITSVNFEDETVFVNRTKEEIKNAPPFDEATYREPSYSEELGTYYGPEGSGYRDW
jgi:hypothetical protein